ncbi:hypothetical protein D3C84_767940 [compost metagenome]
MGCRTGHGRFGGEGGAHGDGQAQQDETRGAKEKHGRSQQRRQQDQPRQQAAHVHGDAVVGGALLGLGRLALDQVTCNRNTVGKQRRGKHHHALVTGDGQQYQPEGGAQQGNAQGAATEHQQRQRQQQQQGPIPQGQDAVGGGIEPDVGLAQHRKQRHGGDDPDGEQAQVDDRLGRDDRCFDTHATPHEPGIDRPA